MSELRFAAKGPVFQPSDPGFAAEIAAFNLATIHSPDLVFGALDASDVVAAVQWAAARQLPVAVQSTGHGATNPIEGGLLISTRRMLELSVDPIEQTARVGAGVTWKAVAKVAALHGLMGLSGSTFDVGVIGYTLGGGLPVLGRKYGFASDHVVSMDFVTADGNLHVVDAESHPELFALLRGGKGNLGIVTALEFRLFPDHRLYAGGIYYPGESAGDVLEAFAAWAPGLPEDASASLALMRLPDAETVPEPVRGKFLAHLRYAHQGDIVQAARLLEPMRACAPIMMDSAGLLPYQRFETIHQDPEQPVPVRESGFLLSGLDAGAVAAILEHLGPGVDSPVLMGEIRLMGGALRGVPGTDCVGGRDAAFSFFMVGIATPDTLEPLQQAFSGVRAAPEPSVTGRTFVNLHGHSTDAADRARAWDEATYRRLAAAKAALDPLNTFRFGHVVEAAALPAVV
ncbi:FAD-binding oxidoreductase [Pseudarthrobacter sp. J75]|uniref:FAD-binding oxidoreductase n=1 Tax=unclassified Pseudarthrobacter TaxID=2647000 RepID=UPI002E811508|nr:MULTISPECIES: FAD-binding oxidoreductase [unclassified Pseudarthrobacter]MEE2524478.1 FAD-binding oxidoreductase [Pseudarthrobacter sp. J47]MEE2530666.1 FAD-binding oxidoreductase [Pseudarthrobacter sp. J75]